MNSPPAIAVIVPTLNEQASLPAALAAIGRQSVPCARVIVADGGSSDDTQTIAERHGAYVMRDLPRGRGQQVAAALKQIDEDVVLVLHADAILPERALALICEHMQAEPSCPGGCLGHRFDSARPIYRWIEWWDQRRARQGRSYGDQGQFFRLSHLTRAGGYPEQLLMEDVELSRRLRRIGRTTYLDCPVTSSPRRFETFGVIRTLLANLLFRAAYRLFGAAACAVLYRHYYRRRIHDAPAA